MKPTLPTCLARHLMTRLVLFTLVLLGLGQTRGFSQDLFHYTNLTSGMGTVAAHIAPATITRGAPDILQATDCMGDQGFGSHGWPTTNTFNVFTFNANKWYVEFTLDPDPGYGLKVTGISARSRRENPAGTANDGPIAMRYGYSTDGVNWTTVNPGNPQSSNICASSGVNRVWPAWNDTLTSNPITIRIYGLSSGSARDGDLFLHDVIVNGVVCANDPSIAPAPDFFATCYGETSVDYTYTSEDGDTYGVDFDDVNFTDIPAGTTLPAGSGTISLGIPANTAPGSYTGTLTVSNSCGFSTEYGFTIEVRALPDVTISVSPATICAGDDITLSFTDDAETGHLFSIVADLVDDNGISVGEINFSGIPDGASAVYTEGVDFDGDVLGVVSLTNIVVTDETTECVNSTEDDLTITVNPLPAAAITVLESSGIAENDGAICNGDNVVLTASGGVSYLWSPGGSTASAIAVFPVATTTYTVTVTSADGCTASASQTITVSPLPDVTVLIAPTDICPGQEITFSLQDNNYDGAQYNVSTSYTHGGGSVPAYDFAGPLGEGLLDTWTEGVDFMGDISFGPFTITETASGCASTVSSTPVSVNVFEPANFEFTASTDGDGPYSGNNTTGPNTLDLDFCVGDHLTLNGYDDNGNIGYLVSYISSGNVTYDGGAIPPASGPSNVAPANAAAFFGAFYGGTLGYGLSSGTLGTINQIFVPYLDNDNSGDYSAGDCLGEAMYLNYNIHAIPDVDAVDDIAVCKGEMVSVDFTGLVPGTAFNWTNDNIAIGLGASGTGNIPAFVSTNTGATDLVATITVTPEANGCSGESFTFTITVHPMPTFGFTATVTGRPAQVGSNAGGPTTVTLDFCAGESFSYTGFSSSTANVGFIEEITGGTTNTLYGITPIPVPRPKTYISAGAAPGFFGGTYGPYDLASGAFGTITEVFTPYFDVDNDGDYDEEVDCLGDPITLVYNIYELPNVIATPDAESICSEGTTSIALSSDVPNTTFAWVVQATTGSVNGQADGSGNSIAQTISGFGTVTYRVTPTGPAPNNCVGEFFDVVITVEPPVAASITANDYLLCQGDQVTFTFNESNYPGGTEFTIDADTTTDYGTGHITIPFVTNGDDLTWTEGVDFHGSLTATNIIVTVDGTPACVGELSDITISVNPPFTPVIYGPTCVHVGAQMQLTADNGIVLPGTFGSGVWSSTPNVTLLDTFDLDTVLVTGYVAGTASIYYTVTDNAGCVSTATFEVEVLDPLTLEHVYTGDPVTCGEEFTVTVEVSNFCDINTIDYPFTWDGNAFQLVDFDTPTQLPGGTFTAFSPGPGELYLIFNDDFVVPYGNELSDGTVVLTYTLRAIGASNVYNIPDNTPAVEAYNGSFQTVPVNTTGVSVAIESISLELTGNPEVCPGDDFVHLFFNNVVGSPNYYVIDFDAAAEAAGFPNIQEGTLVVLDGEIIIPLPDGLPYGSYNAVLVVSNTTYGCVSDEYEFSIIVDTVPPTASNPATVYLSCISAIPAPNPVVVTDEQDNCSDANHITVAYEAGLSSTVGSGCGVDTMYVYRVYSVTDEAGNTIYVTQTIKVVDNLPPTVSTTGLAIWYPSGAAAIAAVVAHANATKSDNCTPLVGINVAVGAVDTAGCTSTIQLIVTDACGNLTPFASSLYTVTIDRQKPTVTAGIIDDCYDEADTPTAPYFEFANAVQAAIDATTASDDCDAFLDITAAISGTDCELVIVVTATDDCGKSNSVTYQTRVENDAPIISPYNTLALDGECFTLEQDAIDAAIAATHAGDDCTAPGDLQYDAFVSGGCPAEIMVVVTDYCGNPSTITYTGVYIDVEDPTVDPDEIYPTCFETEAQALTALAQAAFPADNCSTTAELLASAEASFSGDPCDQTVTITFTDHCGRTVSVDFTNITIDDEDPTGVATQELDYQCIGDVDDVELTASYISADDNCGVESIEFYADDLPMNCGTGYRTYIVTDCAGNTALVTLTIHINDELPPEWVTSPSNDLDRTFLCGEDISAALALEPEAIDVNCGEVDVILISDITGGGCTDQNRTRMWTAIDACGNVVDAPFTQVITIVDNVGPTWVTYAGELNTSVECNDPAGLAAAQSWAPEASDNCTKFTLEKTSGVFVPGGGCPQEGSYTNTWIATDDCGNPSAVYTQVITITDNTGPTWVTPQGLPYPNGLNFTIACDDVEGYNFANSLSPTATDNCDVNAELTKNTGSFVPGSGCIGEGSFTNTWTATDDCGNPSVLFTQTITVVDNTPPTFDPNCQFMPANLYTSFGYDCPQTATVTGLFVNQEINYTYSWNVAGLNVPPLAGCIFDNCTDPSTIIIKVVSIDNQYDVVHCSRTITISFQLRDDCGNVQPTLFVCIYNIIDDTKPVATAGSIGTCYATETAALAAALAATSVSDNCTATNDVIKTAVRTGTLCAATITVTATDCAGNVSDPVTYSTRIDNAAPTMVVSTIPTCYPTVAAAQAAAIAGTTITDDCNTYGQLTITATTIGDCPATVTVTATDQCGNSRSVTYSGLCIGAANSVVITTPASDASTSCENEASALATWLANHGGAVASGSGIVWSYTPDPIVFSAPSCTTHTKSVVVTFKATDGCGYMATTTATFSVSDNAAPTANPIPNTTLSCIADTLPANINVVTGVQDNCDATPTVALFANTKTGTGCPGSPLIIARTYTVTDDYCNTTYITQMITVVDNVAPTFTAPGNITIQVDGACNYNASPGITGDVTNEADNCTPAGPGLQATYTDVVNPGVNHPDKYIITRTWKLLDACGNAAIQRIQTITVQDLISPTIAGCPANNTHAGAPVVVEMINYPCGWTANGLTSPVFNDNCPGAVLSYHLDGFFVGAADGIGTINGKTFLEGTTTVTYTVTDGAGNTASCSFTVTVNCLTISGRIIWEHDDVSGVKDATVKLTQPPAPAQLGTDLSDSNGNYDLSVPAAGTYRITPVKNINRLNGVTSADASAITAHISSPAPGTITDPYKKVCADVNRSGIINTQDATLITQCLAGNPTALAVFNVFWRFTPTLPALPVTTQFAVPAFAEFKDVPVAALDVMGVDFFGMKIGDVASPWADPQMAPTIPPLVWVLQDQVLEAGTELELTFSTSNFNNLAAYQFALDFDPTQLQFVGFQPLGALPMNLLDNFGSYNANMGELRNVWAGAHGTTLTDGTQIFRAKFKVLASGQKLSQVLRLDDSEIPCKAYSEALVPTEMKLVFTESVDTDLPLDPGQLQLQLMQNRPNPFTDATTIGFILPEACEAHIRILDISGRELTAYDRNYTAGYHELDFRMENATSYGVLFCELVTPQGKRTIKMITAK